MAFALMLKTCQNIVFPTHNSGTAIMVFACTLFNNSLRSRLQPKDHRTVPSRLLFGALVLLALGAPACSHHRGPWDIEDYIAHLERPDRDEYQKPEEVLEALELRPGLQVADIGAGSGYFTRRLAQAVGPNGKIFAVDVEPAMLDYNRRHLGYDGPLAPTEFILARPDDPTLPVNSVDLIFLCNVYHHLDHPTAYFEKVKAALKPHGRVVILDFYHDERSGKLGFSKHHLVPQARVIEELTPAGFRLRRELHFLPRQYFLEFEP